MRVFTPHPDYSLMPIRQAAVLLACQVQFHLKPKLIHAHEKVTDAMLIALALLRVIHTQPYFKSWWKMLKLNIFPDLPSVEQATIRLKRLTPVIERLTGQPEPLAMAVIDSEPIPVCRYKRAKHCKFPRATFGFGTQGKIFGFKLHAWTTLNGKIAQYAILPANEHDLTGGGQLAEHWPAYGGPKIIGDKAYQGGGYIVPAKSNMKKPDPRWREEFHAARKIIESAFSSLAGRGLRWGQVKTFPALRLKVALIVIAYNLRFASLSAGVNP
ncbi:IS982 family transposase [Deinococcus cavernae]|uniref:IS982 family transposase n=1 Tax=Deinococcus cavernae TaxID=2320857 RepID=A0A418V9I6_9DEIO|nr:IS982 family transposase [Deinococcus cavernae]RJF71304.1 IS982 family transposase [Deinococcus cavernae]RJF72775.1 IS982 family transposase [Deinococcus cavernae]RJF74586.1 IS982 family transposase [Deinococcus cavernae]RJF75611.1 IS982 family transposase [Deinococcus cavernae]